MDRSTARMSGYLRSQRWLGFLAGAATGGALYISTKVNSYSVCSNLISVSPPPALCNPSLTTPPPPSPVLQRLLWRTTATAADRLPGAPPPPQPREVRLRGDSPNLTAARAGTPPLAHNAAPEPRWALYLLTLRCRSRVQDQEQLFGPGARAYMVRKWNQAVDAVFHPVIKALADRNL